MLKEFKEFALKGNMLDMAVGIIIGAAFTTVVSSLVDDVLMPPIGVMMGGIDFSDYYIQLTNFDQDYASLQAARDAGVTVIGYGNFLNAVIKFLIVAFALFIIVKNINRLKKAMEHEEERKADVAPPPRQEVLLAEIRDALLERPNKT
ncbi:MAG: large conductance mechanosensitive channel protein MscL [Geminicoccaceae bacterium]